MPSPIAHSITGYALSQLPFAQRMQSSEDETIPGSPETDIRRGSHKSFLSHPVIRHFHRGSLALSLYAFVLACLPDLDFLPQLITGIRFHRGPSHSLVAAILVSAMLSLCLSKPLRLSFRSLLGFSLTLYSSHLLLDLFTAGGSGLPLLWPLSDYGFSSPIPLMPAVHHSRGLLDLGHLKFITAEILYSTVLLTFVYRLRQKSQKTTRQAIASSRTSKLS